jgi:hypothetical protein
MVTIKHLFTSEVMFTSTNENQTLRGFILELIEAKNNLSRANLSGADLSRANLSRANLSGVIKMPITCKWSHGITGGLIHIGCEKRSIEDWDKFFASDEVITTERNTHEFKQIQAVYEAYKAYLNFLNK